ncbi:hypothetical protein BD309DRAFT_1004001 [Dichomitus squalens]|uniref:Protein-S-isoprenylcysteine O-methyltransferase n=1 Tax=Dichomitus squalens TaxID=114155 RepID=A0A4Q9ND98_9APHY|nr:hypothetical protein BD309DRAFT_1004001 [Dichomitus squalens]TBU51990.1 hypothetical protein BD310DRAFT_862540 [Dichomitus squalens]
MSHSTMLPLIPFLTTPLLKVPLLAGHAMCTYWSMTPPRGAAPAVEQKTRGEPQPDFMSTRFAWILRYCTSATKIMMCGIAAAEVAVLLAQYYPASEWSRAVSRFLPIPGPSALRINVASTIASLLGVTGGLIRMWCFRTLGRFFTWEITVREKHELITNGPYSFVRHPSYTGSTMVTAGNILLLTTGGSYFTEAGLWDTIAGRAAGAFFIGYMTWVICQLLGRIGREDQLLQEAFGPRWDDWARRIPYLLIPLVY